MWAINIVFQTSGFDRSLTILTGRPHGGLAILFKRFLADKIRRDECENIRKCVTSFHQDGKARLLFINVYMPCDKQPIHCLNPEYNDTISDNRMLLFDPIGDVISGGDWNTDQSRDTDQSKSFESFLESNFLCGCRDHTWATQQPTYVTNSLHATSCIERYLVSSNVFDCLRACCVNTNHLTPNGHRDISIPIYNTASYYP